MIAYFRCLAWLCLLWVGPVSLGQVITIRIINGKNGRPLSKRHITMTLLDEKTNKISSHLNLETDAHGEARFTLPDPVPTKLSAMVHLKSRSWRCRCWAFVATQDVVQQGAVGGQNLIRAAIPVRAEPGQIVFIAHRVPFLEQLLGTLLAPLME